MIEVSKKNANVVELEIPAKPRYVGVARLIVSSLARMLDFHEESIDDLKIAISELCTNAIVHSNDQDIEYPITIRYSSGDDFLAVEVQDRGPGFDVSCVGRVREDGLVERGFGIPLIKSLVDDFQCTSEPEAGTCITITKFR